MKVFEGLEAFECPAESATVAIGTFDGIHLGHQSIIRTAVEDAARCVRPSVVFTFDRHPSRLLAPERAPGYLTTLSQRERLLSGLNVDYLVVASFDRTLSELTPHEFIREILKRRLRAGAVVVGVDFAFGKSRSGDVPYLASVQAEFDFRLYALSPVVVDGAPASSTRIRELIRAGRIGDAERILGHAYRLAGTVIGGQKLGRQLGYPTANLALEIEQIVPLDGIYAVQVRLDDGRIVGGACSIGNRPTIEGAGRSIETFLFGADGADFYEDLYGKSIEIRFLSRLRAEAKFDSLDALKEQMARDVAAARMICDNADEEAKREYLPL